MTIAAIVGISHWHAYLFFERPGERAVEGRTRRFRGSNDGNQIPDPYRKHVYIMLCDRSIQELTVSHPNQLAQFPPKSSSTSSSQLYSDTLLLCAAFPIALKHHLRFESGVDHGDLDGLLPLDCAIARLCPRLRLERLIPIFANERCRWTARGRQSARKAW